MWQAFIPTSMEFVGSLCLGLAVLLVLIDMPGKGVPWAKVGAIIALIGGFGALGGAGGWVGNQILSGGATAVSWGERWAGQAIGVAGVAVVFLGLVFWAASRVQGKGVKQGSGKGVKLKGLITCACLAVVGAAIAAAIPPLYNFADWAVATIGHGFINLVN